MKKPLPLPIMILLDLLLVGVILTTFAFFHHVLPMLNSSHADGKSSSVSSYSVPAVTAPPSSAPDILPEADLHENAEEISDPEKDLTEWQLRFADHFTDEVIRTDNSYSSPTVAVTVDKVVLDEGGKDQITYFVADIYVASVEHLRAWVANGRFEYFSTQDVLEMDAACDAIVSVNGDFYSYQPTGFLVRNGQVYMRDYTYCDLCVLFNDGTLECFARNTYNIDELLERGVWQAWNFGPSLLDAEGHVKRYYEVPTTVSYVNPRSAIGYYEPGHYCFVLVDGRQAGYSKGMTIDELAEIFEGLGCSAAYNLDGGGSAVMTFNHDRYSQQSNNGDRALGDIVLATDTIPEENISFFGEDN